MGVALKHPNRLDGLLVIDSAPLDYLNLPETYKTPFDVITKIQAMNMENRTRDDVSKELRQLFTPTVANLLLTNLVFIKDTDFVKWRINVPVLHKYFRDIIKFNISGLYPGEIKVILGELSQPYNTDVFKPFFPNITENDIVTIPKAGKIHLIIYDKRSLGTFGPTKCHH